MENTVIAKCVCIIARQIYQVQYNSELQRNYC